MKPINSKVKSNGYFDILRRLINKCGGKLTNAHAHLDRAGTLDKAYLSHIGMDPITASSYSLRVKQDLVGDLHRGIAYEENNLRERIRAKLNEAVNVEIKKIYSFIDVTADNVGLNAIKVALELKKEFKNKIDFRVGAYPIFGFKDRELKRWEIFEKGAEMADYIGGLPERDVKKGHIGYDNHVKRLLLLGKKLNKPVHFHVDQANDPRENGTETIIEAVRWLHSPKIDEDEPSVWVVHAISPSTYEEDRFQGLLDGLINYDIGVICCPTAAISMRQIRSIKTPIFNSIARVLDMLERGVNVKLGTDNVEDVFIPTGTPHPDVPDIFMEVYVIANALRFGNPDIWAKVITETKLNNVDKEVIKVYLEEQKKS